MGTGLRIRLGAGYLLMYEGAMTNRSGGPTLAVENDVWISNDDGATWDLIAGRSFYGTSGPVAAWGNQANTFVGRSGSNNCNDPLSDLTISIGGVNPVTGNSTAVAITSFNGVGWTATEDAFGPQRHFSSCDITERGDAVIIGGHFSAVNVAQDVLLNDVWRGPTGDTPLGGRIPLDPRHRRRSLQPQGGAPRTGSVQFFLQEGDHLCHRGQGDVHHQRLLWWDHGERRVGFV